MARRRRVTFFINSLEQGGAERQLTELMTGLDSAAFEPSLVLCKGADQLGHALPKGAITVLDAPMFPTPASVWRLRNEFARLQPDIVHTFKGWENVFGRLAAKQAGVKAVVSSVRCTQLPWSQIAAEAATHPYADAIIVNSVGIRDELVARARIPASRIDVVENGVDLARFKPMAREEREAERAAWGMAGTRTLVVPGRICDQKNHLCMVQALGALKRRGALPPDVRVLFAGRDSLVTYGPRVRALVAFYGLGAQVQFVGVVKAIEKLVGASDGVLLPSKYEGLPNAVIESMAAGVFCIVSPAANTDGLVDDGATGIVCEDASAGAIERALGRYFALDDGARRRLGEEAMARTRRRFTVARMVESTVAVYDRLVPGESNGVLGGAPGDVLGGVLGDVSGDGGKRVEVGACAV